MSYILVNNKVVGETKDHVKSGTKITYYHWLDGTDVTAFPAVISNAKKWDRDFICYVPFVPKFSERIGCEGLSIFYTL